jgi:hypothetical protein
MQGVVQDVWLPACTQLYCWSPSSAPGAVPCSPHQLYPGVAVVGVLHMAAFTCSS